MNSRINVAILGAGTIAPDFLLSSTFVDDVIPYCIFGQETDLPVMEKLKQEYSLEKIYTNYDELLNDDHVDVVYVALPNSLHYGFAKKAMEKGKHVIVEKPFCSSEKEAEELFEIAEENNRFLFEAIPNIHFPNYKEIRNMIDKIGDIKIVELNVSKYSRRYDDFKTGVTLPAFDPKKGGGSLMDMGVYNIHFLVGLFGKPDKVEYYPNIERNIDTSGILFLKYPSFCVSAIAAKDCSAPSCINIQGDKGYIHSDSTTHLLQGFEIKTNEGERQHFDLNERVLHERLAYEIKEFADIIRNTQTAEYMKLKKQTLNVMNVIDQAKERVYG